MFVKRLVPLFAALGPALATPAPKLKDSVPSSKASDHHKVVILGGGVAGIIAARTLSRAGIQDFIIVEARHELGGRMMSRKLDNLTIELGPNWVEGTISDKTQAVNPIYALALKHNISLAENNWDDLNFYDETGVNPNDFKERFDAAGDFYDALVDGAADRIKRNLVDLTARAGFQLTGRRNTRNKYDWASEYYNYDWEYAQTPEQSSWMETGNNDIYTFDPTIGFGDETLLCVDQRGFATLIQKEAATFLKPDQTLLNATANSITYTDSGATIQLTNGKTLTADHLLVTVSVGVLQHDEDLAFHPALPDWKREAIDAMKMATYTKIFLKFDNKWWDNTEMGLYADPHKRGYYPVWQSLDHPSFFPGSHVYFVTVTGDESERLEAMTDAEVEAEILVVLQNMYPGVKVPKPTEMVFPRWFSDPLYRGSFSNWPAGFFVEHMQNLRASVKNVHFAGEATSFEYYGYLHAAYFEGLARGRFIAKCVTSGGKDCQATTTGKDVVSANLRYPEEDDITDDDERR